MSRTRTLLVVALILCACALLYGMKVVGTDQYFCDACGREILAENTYTDKLVIPGVFYYEQDPESTVSVHVPTAINLRLPREVFEFRPSNTPALTDVIFCRRHTLELLRTGELRKTWIPENGADR